MNYQNRELMAQRCGPTELDVAIERRRELRESGDINGGYPVWYDNSANISTLLAWMDEHDEAELTIEWLCYFLSKPWKWQDAWDRMQSEKSR